jgi:hypothetical protein
MDYEDHASEKYKKRIQKFGLKSMRRDQIECRDQDWRLVLVFSRIVCEFVNWVMTGSPSKRDEVTGGLRRLRDEELHKFRQPPLAICLQTDTAPR